MNKGDFLGSCDGFNSAIAGYQPFGVGVYPNPFTDFTEIHYDLLEEGSLTLAIYDFNGNLLETPVDGLTAVGEYQYIFYGASYPGNMFYLIVHYQGHEVVSNTYTLIGN